MTFFWDLCYFFSITEVIDENSVLRNINKLYLKIGNKYYELQYNITIFQFFPCTFDLINTALMSIRFSVKKYLKYF